jgi:DNA modification methylase
MTSTIHVGDAREVLARLPANSVQVVCTSPPYFGLRSYSTAPQIWGGDATCSHEWGEAIRTPWANEVPGPSQNVPKNGASRSREKYTGPFCLKCNAWRGELGSEPTVDLFIDHLVDVFRGVWRVLRDDGTCWINIGDSYSGGGKGPHGATSQLNGRGVQKAQAIGGRRNGGDLPAKNLMMVPARLALALQDDGWIIRNDVAWLKKSPMPESVTDRMTSAWEHIFLLTKQQKYYYDAEAVRIPFSETSHANGKGSAFSQEAPSPKQAAGDMTHYPGEHFRGGDSRPNPAGRNLWNYWTLPADDLSDAWLLGPEPLREQHYAAFPTEIPRRAILAGSRPGDTVLDPFLGSGTTLLVADQLGRHGVGIELNPVYATMAEDRIRNAAPMFASVSIETANATQGTLFTEELVA